MEYKPSRSFAVFSGLALVVAGVITGAGPLASRMYDPLIQRYQDQITTISQGSARITATYSRRAEESRRQVRNYKSKLEWANAHICNNADIYVPQVGSLQGNQLWRSFEGDFENGSCRIVIDRDIICSDN